MTTKEILSSAQQEMILQNQRAQVALIENAAQLNAIAASGEFVFFAAFDGTNNDLNNAQDPQNTNVAQLYLQAQNVQASSPHLSASYYPGPGTKGSLARSSWEHAAVTVQVIATAKRAYDDFTEQASAWLKRNSGKRVTTALTCFSRGCASAAIFSQMVFEKGLADPEEPGRNLVAPGKVTVSAGVLFDPVMTCVQGNVAFPPNVRNIVQMRAQDEYRQLFKAADYAAQSFVKCVDMLGCHCDIGGSYDNGIAGLTLEAATTFLQKSGLPIAGVEPARRFSSAQEVAIHSEELDDFGNPKWDVYGHFNSISIAEPSPRLMDKTVRISPATEEASGGYIMTLYDGRRVTIG